LLIAAVGFFALVIFKDNYEVVEQTKNDYEPESEEINISQIYTGEVQKNSSLYTELLLQEVPETAVAQITSHFSELFDLTNSHPGDEFKLFISPGDTVLAFEYVTHDLRKYRIEKVGDEYVDKITEVELEKRIEFIGTVIETNLWDALSDKLPERELFTKITDIYAWEIDFFTESRLGDRFKMVYETYYKDGYFVKTGDILAAEYDLLGTPHRAILYTDPEGYTDYYDENGYSLRRALLKSPLNYRRISSSFSRRRLHPVYKIYRPHLGVDYAAAKGTPVVAAGDGIVKSMGWVNGFGNYIEIQHEYGLTTGYGHLKNFARGVADGRRVRQGQVIGYVGMTGIATGPHLDYRVKKHDHYANPLKMTVPASPPVKAIYINEFSRVATDMMGLLNRRVDPELYVMNH
jgi:murein DD-endopeptidase MepM/ murein hydrolase activator NlpD